MSRRWFQSPSITYQEIHLFESPNKTRICSEELALMNKKEEKPQNYGKQGPLSGCDMLPKSSNQKETIQDSFLKHDITNVLLTFPRWHCPVESRGIPAPFVSWRTTSYIQ